VEDEGLEPLPLWAEYVEATVEHFDDFVTCRVWRALDRLDAPPDDDELPDGFGETAPLEDELVASRPLRAWVEYLFELHGERAFDHFVSLDLDVLAAIRRHTDGSLPYLVNRGLRVLAEHLRAWYPYPGFDDESLRRHLDLPHHHRIYLDAGDFGCRMRIDPDVPEELRCYLDDAKRGVAGLAHLIRWGQTVFLDKLEGRPITPDETPAIAGSAGPPSRPARPPVAADPISRADFRAVFSSWLTSAR
jgi:hypothetical protein